MKKLSILVLTLLMMSSVYAKQNKSKNTKKIKCDRSKYCKHISSCKEAKYLLKQCGMQRLDRDKDGVPCENICSGG